MSTHSYIFADAAEASASSAAKIIELLKATLATRVQAPYTPRKFPVQIVTYNNPNALWLLDNAAARLMD